MRYAYMACVFSVLLLVAACNEDGLFGEPQRDYGPAMRSASGRGAECPARYEYYDAGTSTEDYAVQSSKNRLLMSSSLIFRLPEAAGFIIGNVELHFLVSENAKKLIPNGTDVVTVACSRTDSSDCYGYGLGKFCYACELGSILNGSDPHAQRVIISQIGAGGSNLGSAILTPKAVDLEENFVCGQEHLELGGSGVLSLKVPTVAIAVKETAGPAEPGRPGRP